MTVAKLLVYVVSAFFVLYGLAFAAKPFEMFLLVADSELASSSGLVDLRATYGGMAVAVGFAIAYLARRDRLDEALVVSAAILFGMAMARGIGLLAEGPTNWLMYLYLALEIIGGGLALALRRYTSSSADDA